MLHGKVIIIGAGISGLVTGILLQAVGIEVEIFERRSSIHSLGGGIGIWPNGSEVLLSLPCAKKIASLPAMINHDVFGDANGNTLTVMSRNFFQAINGFPIMNICRSDLHQILLDEFGIENVRFNMKCSQIKNTEKAGIVVLENGESYSANLIIGADGIYSTIRKTFLSQTQLDYTGYIQLLGIFRGIKQTKHNFVFGQNRYALHFPIADDRFIFYQALPYPKDKLNKAGSREEQIALFRGWSEEVDTILDCYEQSLLDDNFKQHFFCDQAYESPPLLTWHQGRTVLIGDAAHPMGSIFGLAAGVAIEDAYTLSQCLIQSSNLDNALMTYEQHQRPRAIAFLALEQEITRFLLHADEKQYNDFLSEFKITPPEIYNQRLISLLEGTYKNAQTQQSQVVC